MKADVGRCRQTKVDGGIGKKDATVASHSRPYEDHSNYDYLYVTDQRG